MTMIRFALIILAVSLVSAGCNKARSPQNQGGTEQLFSNSSKQNEKIKTYAQEYNHSINDINDQPFSERFDGKSYLCENFGYSIQVPEGWHVDEQDSGASFKILHPDEGNDSGLVLEVTPNSNAFNEQEYLEQFCSFLKSTDHMSLRQKSTTEIAGFKAGLTISEADLDSEKAMQIVIFLCRDIFLYKIHAVCGDKEYSEMEKIFLNTAHSLKFSDIRPTSEYMMLKDMLGCTFYLKSLDRACKVYYEKNNTWPSRINELSTFTNPEYNNFSCPFDGSYSLKMKDVMRGKCSFHGFSDSSPK